MHTAKILSDWTDAQADLSLRWAYSHFVGFVVRMLKLFILSSGFHGRETVRGTCRLCIRQALVELVRTALNFGKQTVSCQYYNLKFGIYTIIDLHVYSVK